MRGNGIRHTTTGTGTGAVTLSAVPGWPSYANVFGSSGTRIVEYTICNDDGVPIEGGFGTITLSTLSLARDVPWFTWDEGGEVYNDASPTPLNLPSGTKQVICAPMMQSEAWTMPHIMASGPVEDVGTTTAHAFGAANSVWAADTELYGPFLWLGTRPIVQATVRPTTGVDGSAIKAVLYEMVATGPGARLIDFGTFATASAQTNTNVSNSVTPITLPPGWYVVGMIKNSTQVVRALTSSGPSPMGTGASVPVRFLTRTGSYASGMPDPGPTSGFTANTTNALPAIYLKQAT